MEYKIGEHTVIVDDTFIFNPTEFSIYKNRNTFYCYRKRDATFLHHLVVGKQPHKIVDHRDRNGLNNTKNNLRFVTRSQNTFNSSVFNSTKGTYKCSKTGKFYTRIKIEGVRISYGPFLTEEEAHNKYKELLSLRVAE
jgi:hypothetical protein